MGCGPSKPRRASRNPGNAQPNRPHRRTDTGGGGQNPIDLTPHREFMRGALREHDQEAARQLSEYSGYQVRALERDFRIQPNSRQENYEMASGSGHKSSGHGKSHHGHSSKASSSGGKHGKRGDQDKKRSSRQK
ncbi:hypothetical protein XA68_16452 [Ophiocordyceps unilateralis]|uniref:Uncharacterized protein n=1 Tax=Ophiocordyceps unilateralis TaxID=268505 RepID=A0A2A9PL17_OPHUN|nr:hypothetical protein XA68_16452 [Ophiocordyceps unilateralis]